VILAMAARTRPLPPAPLLEWRGREEAEGLEGERRSLIARIPALKPRSYARVIAEARLRDLTHRALCGPGDGAGSNEKKPH
jgi:hypothetical protein